ncbi:MAG: hypothetical protein M0Q13_15440 [Methanothrix sp.]|jgi:hypothetical protein|nr:hypothetical protein [Methanothrix sp.]
MNDLDKRKNGYIEDSNCDHMFVHKMIEYNAKVYEPSDNYIVILNIRGSSTIFGYMKNNCWYTEDDELIENKEDIISYFDLPIPYFFGKRKVKK